MRQADSVASAFALLRSLGESLPELVQRRVRLLTLELRRAGDALALIAALTIVAALMLATAWLALWGAVAAALVETGLHWGWVALLILLLNGATALLLLMKVRTLGRLLTLPATLRQLGVANEGGPASTAAAETVDAAAAAAAPIPNPDSPKYP
jgi:hypothetical protein